MRLSWCQFSLLSSYSQMVTQCKWKCVREVHVNSNKCNWTDLHNPCLHNILRPYRGRKA